jgi:hypothetical protein
MVIFNLPSVLLLVTPFAVDGATKQFNPLDSIFSSFTFQRAVPTENRTQKFLDPFAPSAAEREAERQARRRRMKERNERVKETFKNIQPKTVEKVPEEDLEQIDEKTRRQLGWGNRNGGELSYFVDPGEDYDMWSQAYRMIGGYIDCDNSKEEGGSGDNGGGDGDAQACSRWMMWASVSIQSIAQSELHRYIDRNKMT